MGSIRNVRLPYYIGALSRRAGYFACPQWRDTKPQQQGSTAKDKATCCAIHHWRLASRAQRKQRRAGPASSRPVLSCPVLETNNSKERKRRKIKLNKQTNQSAAPTTMDIVVAERSTHHNKHAIYLPIVAPLHNSAKHHDRTLGGKDSQQASKQASKQARKWWADLAAHTAAIIYDYKRHSHAFPPPDLVCSGLNLHP